MSIDGWGLLPMAAGVFYDQFQSTSFNHVNRWMGTSHRCLCSFNRAESDAAAGAE